MSDGSLAESINKLVDQSLVKAALEDAKPAQPIGPSRGTGRMQVAAKAAGGGIASPLIETSYASRTYHVGVMVTSSDGLFTFQALKTINFVDANSNAVQLQFAAPP